MDSSARSGASGSISAWSSLSHAAFHSHSAAIVRSAIAVTDQTANIILADGEHQKKVHRSLGARSATDISRLTKPIGSLLRTVPD